VLIADISGSIISTDRSDAVTRYQYTGRDWDADSGLQYNRLRWYDPATGRWVSEDPIGFAGGDANLARYVGNGATNATDPSGLQAQEPDDLFLTEEQFEARKNNGEQTDEITVALTIADHCGVARSVVFQIGVVLDRTGTLRLNYDQLYLTRLKVEPR
jgi:RHS repeat-associated protein